MKSRRHRPSTAFHPNFGAESQGAPRSSAAMGNFFSMAALERRLQQTKKGSGQAPTPDTMTATPEHSPAAGKGHPLGTDAEWHAREQERGRKHLRKQATLVARLTKISETSLMAIFEFAAQTKDPATALHNQTPTPTNRVGVDPTDEAHIGVSAGNKAYSFDWDTHSSHVTPVYPDWWNEETIASASVRDVFNAHFDALLTKEFGGGVTRAMVGSALAASQWADASAAVAVLEAGIFRAEQEAAILSLNVEESSRYAGYRGSTYCNVYAHDLVQALGGYLPRVWWYEKYIDDIKAGKEVISKEERDRRLEEDPEQIHNTLVAEYGVTVRELSANGLCDWFRDYSSDFGWRRTTDIEAAQDAANAGKLVILSARNSGHRGHITVIAAETDEHKADRDPISGDFNPLESQAGYNSMYDTGRAGNEWWKDKDHTDGAAFILEIPRRSNLLTPEQVMGLI